MAGKILRLTPRRKIVILILLIFFLSLMIRLYYVALWRNVPTSDPYHFIGWASGIGESSHLKFPGSEDTAYGQYPNGYPMILHMISSTTGNPLLPLTMFLPAFVGSLCIFPVYLVFRRMTRDPISCLTGTAIVTFSFAFIKYTCVSLPNMLGLYLFAFAVWLAFKAGRSSKRILAILVLTIPVAAKIHYLSLVCIGVLIAIIVSRKVMISASGTEFDPRRLAFLLIVALVAGVLAWTAAYRIMWELYGINITMQPPPRLSIVLKLAGYPLVFGLIQTIALPLGLISLARIYYNANFKGEIKSALLDPLLLFALWLVFFIFALGFLHVEYYPFRFNCYLMIPFGMISLLGILLVRDFLLSRTSTALLGSIVLPVTIFLALLQPLVISVVPLSGGEPFLPWKQEYGQTEIPVMESWIPDNLLSTIEYEYSSVMPRHQIIMADWVRSRTLKAFGSRDVHLHWWFFQGWMDLEGQPFPFRSLDVYSGDIDKALYILGRLNLRYASGSTGGWVYYYKYIYASDWIAKIMRNDFGVEADFSKFESYNGSSVYRYDLFSDIGKNDQVLPKSQSKIDPLYTNYPLKPFDKLYSCPGVRIYYYSPLER